MTHLSKQRKFGRTSKKRVALLRALATSLAEHGRIKTTLAKAKDLRPIIEKLITLGKNKTIHSVRLAKKFLYTELAVKNIFDKIASTSSGRQGGYTRILKCGFRKGDAAPSAIIEIIDFYNDKKNSSEKDKLKPLKQVKQIEEIQSETE